MEYERFAMDIMTHRSADFSLLGGDERADRMFRGLYEIVKNTPGLDAAKIGEIFWYTYRGAYDQGMTQLADGMVRMHESMRALF